MNDIREQNGVERRRRLLKGALGASSVLTLGYGGSAAAASLGCVAKVREIDGGYPLAQFTTDPTSGTNANWQWVQVEVQRYEIWRGNNGQGNGKGKLERVFDGFSVADRLYATDDPTVTVVGASLMVPQPEGYPKAGWVLAYFDDQGGLSGTYPTFTSAADGATPATASCLASINPNRSNGTTARFSG